MYTYRGLIEHASALGYPVGIYTSLKTFILVDLNIFTHCIKTLSPEGCLQEDYFGRLAPICLNPESVESV